MGKRNKGRESDFVRKLMQKLRAIPDSCWYRIETNTQRGFPDVIGCVKGKFIALEAKREKAGAFDKKGRCLLQRYTLENMRKANAFAEFIYPENEEEILFKLRNL